MSETTHHSAPAPARRPYADRRTWERLVYTLLFVVAFNLAEFVLWTIAAIQFLFKLATGDPNARLRDFGQGLGTFIYEVVLFLTFKSDRKPFPFAPWPAGAPAGAAAGRRRAGRPDAA